MAREKYHIGFAKIFEIKYPSHVKAFDGKWYKKCILQIDEKW